MAAPNFNFARLTGFTPYEGGAKCDLLDFEGAVEMEIRRMEAKVAKEDSTKWYFQVEGLAVDDDVKGARLVGRPFFAGSDKNGDALERQFGEFLIARGMPLETIHQLAAQGQQMTPDAICAQYNTPKNPDGTPAPYKTIIAVIGTDEYQGQRTTTISGWASRERFEQMKTTGAHRRKPRDVTKKAAGAVPAATINLGGTNGTGATPTASAAASAVVAGLPNL